MKIDKTHINILKLAAAICLLLPCAANAQQATAEAAKPAGGDGTSLTDFIDQNQDKNDTAPLSGNWLQNAAGKLAQKGAEIIAPKDEKKLASRRSNVSVFDISGIMLRMNVEQVMNAMQKRGYKKTSDHWEIPNFIRWRYEEQCRNQGIVGYERIANCVLLLSKENNYQHVQQINFNNFKTKESIEVYFTSNFTGNKVYRVMYQTEAANITGSGAKAEYLRNIKIFDFWKKVNQKYGRPDNEEAVSWGLGERKPFLKAATGKLILEDPILLELDYTRMSREDQKFMNTAVYTF